MTKYAIIEVGTKQYKVQEGETLEVQRIDGTQLEIDFDQVLMVVDGDKVEVGTPTVSGVKVFATYVEDKKGLKLQVFKYKSKSKYRKMRGARQTYSYLRIDAIGSSRPKAEKVTKEPKSTAKPAKAAKVATVKKAVKKPAAK